MAGLKPSELDAVAVTEGPGLVGALLIGINAAKAFAFANGLPIIGVHHIAGHIYANELMQPMEFPLLALIVSGGHTELVLMEEHGSFKLIGETRDDAAGEAYDKVARVLGFLTQVVRKSISWRLKVMDKSNFREHGLNQIRMTSVSAV